MAEKRTRKPKTEWVADKGRWQPVEEEGENSAESRREQARREQAQLLAVGVVRMVSELTKGAISSAIGTEVVRSSTRVGVMLRGATRTRSEQDALNKLRGAEEAIDETVYWLEIMREAEIGTQAEVIHLRDLALELTDIITDDLRTQLAAASAAKAARNERPDRPRRDFGDRPPRDFGDRPPRPYGDRGGDRGGDRYGDRGRGGGYGNDRPPSDRPRRPYGNDDRPNRPYRRRED